MKNSNQSFIYKTTFKDGRVHYQRAADCWSVKTYKSHIIACYKNAKRNVEFENKFFTEQNTAIVSIIFKGSTDEAIILMKELISNEADCMNKNRSTTVRKSNHKILNIKREFTKVMSSGTQKMYFIDYEYGCRMGLKDKFGTMRHPINKNFVLLNYTHINQI
jgi:hypothetical protein